MKTILPLLALPVVLAAPLYAAKEPKPEYTAHEVSGAYIITFPHKPDTKDSKLESGNTKIAVSTAKVEFAGLVYTVSRAEYPEAFDSTKPETILDGIRDGMKGRDGQIKLDKSITLGDVPGREIVIQAGSNSIRAKVYVVKHVVTQVMVVGAKDKIDTAIPTEFFKSFGWAK